MFYCSQTDNQEVLLPEEEAKHCLQVLRHKEGDKINLFDGKGCFYVAIIKKAGKKSCAVQILERHHQAANPYYAEIAIAPTKNIDRFEWFVEKAVEIGVQEISPVITVQSERRKLRNDRLDKVCLSAAKQSVKAFLPQVNGLLPFKDYLHSIEDKPQRFIAHMSDTPLPHLIKCCKPSMDTIVLIGPEGDFTAAEIELAHQFGFISVSLGESRLRTETAGIAACLMINLANLSQG